MKILVHLMAATLICGCLDAPVRPDRILPDPDPRLGTFGADELDGLIDLGSVNSPWSGVMGLGDLHESEGVEVFASTPDRGLFAFPALLEGDSVLDQPLLSAPFQPAWTRLGFGGEETPFFYVATSSATRVDPLPLADPLDFSQPDEEPWISGRIGGGSLAVPGTDLIWVAAEEWTEPSLAAHLYDMAGAGFDALDAPLATLHVDATWGDAKLHRVTEVSITGDGDADLLLITDYGAGLIVHADPEGPLTLNDGPTARFEPAEDLDVLAAFEGDLDGDGEPDLAVMTSDRSGPSAAALFFGPLGGDYSLDAPDARVLIPDGTDFGSVGRVAGDFNGDGVLDLVFGDPLADGNRGRVRLVYGPFEPGERVVEQGDVELVGSAPGCELFSFLGGDQMGRLVMLGDADDDGIDDLYVALNRVANPEDSCNQQDHRATVGVLYGRR